MHAPESVQDQAGWGFGQPSLVKMPSHGRGGWMILDDFEVPYNSNYSAIL